MLRLLKEMLVRWVVAWSDIASGVVCVLTFGLYRPWWDFNLRAWVAKKQLLRRLVAR